MCLTHSTATILLSPVFSTQHERTEGSCLEQNAGNMYYKVIHSELRSFFWSHAQSKVDCYVHAIHAKGDFQLHKMTHGPVASRETENCLNAKDI